MEYAQSILTVPFIVFLALSLTDVKLYKNILGCSFLAFCLAMTHVIESILTNMG